MDLGERFRAGQHVRLADMPGVQQHPDRRGGDVLLGDQRQGSLAVGKRTTPSARTLAAQVRVLAANPPQRRIVQSIPAALTASAAPRAQAALADPADRITFDDSVRLALLVMLQKLSPAERVVFVLHDVFRMPFDTIARTVGRPTASCRQLAKRARQKIADGRADARFDVESATHRLVTDTFIAACASGGLDGLLAVLAPDAWGDIDLGPAVTEPRSVVTGAENVAANLLRFWGPGSTLVSHSVGGQPALLGFHGRSLAALLILRMRGEQVEAVHVIADPAQIGFLSRQLATSG